MADPNQAPAFPDLTPESYLDLLGQLRGMNGRLSHAESGISHAQSAVAEANARASHADAVAAETSARAAQADAQRMQAEALLAQAQAHTQAAQAQAAAQAAAQAQAAAHNMNSSGARPKRPDDFKGKDSILPITMWIIIVEQYLRVSGYQPAVWAEHVATMLAGPALIWWAKRKIDGIADHDTWNTLKSALLAEFARPNAVRNLRDRLAACHQTGSALSYANAFRAILVELPAGEIAPQEAFDRFYRGLRPHLRVEINKARINDLTRLSPMPTRSRALTLRDSLATTNRSALHGSTVTAAPQPSAATLQAAPFPWSWAPCAPSLAEHLQDHLKHQG